MAYQATSWGSANSGAGAPTAAAPPGAAGTPYSASGSGAFWEVGVGSIGCVVAWGCLPFVLLFACWQGGVGVWRKELRGGAPGELPHCKARCKLVGGIPGTACRARPAPGPLSLDSPSSTLLLAWLLAQPVPPAAAPRCAVLCCAMLRAGGPPLQPPALHSRPLLRLRQPGWRVRLCGGQPCP